MRGATNLRSTMVAVLALRGAGAQTRVLLARRAKGHLGEIWSYIAGHVETGETAWQAAQRELFEETALTPRALYATSFCETFYSVHDDSIEIVPAFVARIDADAGVTLNREHTAFDWFTFDAAAQRVPFGSQRDLLWHVEREFVHREPSRLLLI